MKKNLKDCYVEETEWNIVGFSKKIFCLNQ